MPVSGSNVVAAADAYSAMIEKVSSVTPVLVEQTDTLSRLIKKGKVEQISDRLCRVPLVKYYGGTFQKFDADGGVIGTGSGMSITHMMLGYIYSNYGVAISNRTRDTTSNSGQSKIQVFATQQMQAIKELAVYNDITLHTDGTGLLTNESSAISGTTGLTFAGNAGTTFPNPYYGSALQDGLGVNLLREGMAVEVFSSNLATKRANGSKAGYPAIITSIDYDARSVTLDSNITGLTQGDRLSITGLTATLNSGASSWPLTGDSFRHGMPYVNGVNTAWYYNGILRSSLPQINPTVVNAQGQFLTHNHILIARDRTYQRRDASVFKGMFGIMNMAQRAQLFNIGISISEWHRGPKDKMIDLMPESMDYEAEFIAAGIPHYISKRQPRNRVDYINPGKNWGRAQLFDLRPKKFGDNGYLMPMWNSTGQLIAAEQMFWEESFDFFCYDPGAQMVIHNLGVQSGYTPGT